MATITIRDEDNAFGVFAFLAYVRQTRDDATISDDGTIVIPTRKAPTRIVRIPNDVRKLTTTERAAIDAGEDIIAVRDAEALVRRVQQAAREQAKDARAMRVRR